MTKENTPDNNPESMSSIDNDFENIEDIQEMFEQPLFDGEEKEGQINDITEEFKRGYKLYNFRRPDKFSK